MNINRRGLIALCNVILLNLHCPVLMLLAIILPFTHHLAIDMLSSLRSEDVLLKVSTPALKYIQIACNTGSL